MEAKSMPREQDVATRTVARSHPILNGWKEIADYVGRGLRTVQRWEGLGLPVRRPNARLRSAVVSTAAEIDGWLAQCGDGRTVRRYRPAEEYDRLQQEVVALRLEVEKLRAEARSLRQQIDRISGVPGRSLRSRANVSTDAA